MDAQQLDALEAMHKRATQGEWNVYDGCSWRRIGLSDGVTEILWPEVSRHDRHPDIGGVNRDNDLALIVAMRNALPDLLAAARERDALQRDLAALRTAHDIAETYARTFQSIESLVCTEEGDGIIEQVESLKCRLGSAHRDLAAARAEVAELRNSDPEPDWMIWTCKIAAPRSMVTLEEGSDAPMRAAVRCAFAHVAGVDDWEVFSGWNGRFTPGEREFVKRSRAKHPTPGEPR